MVAGKLLVDPIRPGDGIFNTLLVGNGILAGLGWVLRRGERCQKERRQYEGDDSLDEYATRERSEELLAPESGKRKRPRISPRGYSRRFRAPDFLV